MEEIYCSIIIWCHNTLINKKKMKYIIVLLVIFSALVQAQSIQLTSVYSGTTCSRKPLSQIFMSNTICLVVPCSGGADKYGTQFSSKMECVNDASLIPSTPEAGYYLMSTFLDFKCKTNHILTVSMALDTCVPVYNETYNSVKYNGCNTITQYSDKECQTIIKTVPTGTIDCLAGISVKCNNGRSNTGSVISSSIALIVLCMVIVAFFMSQ